MINQQNMIKKLYAGNFLVDNSKIKSSDVTMYLYKKIGF